MENAAVSFDCRQHVAVKVVGVNVQEADNKVPAQSRNIFEQQGKRAFRFCAAVNAVFIDFRERKHPRAAYVVAVACAVSGKVLPDKIDFADTVPH